MVQETELHSYVGQPPFASDKIYEITPPGVVMGLAWSSQGGNSLYIEAAAVERGEGKGSLRTTGQLPLAVVTVASSERLNDFPSCLF